MKVTRDVIVDLWPAYESGTASADTRALVDLFLAGDPELAGRLREGEGPMRELLFPESVLLSPDVEKAAFDRMRELSRLRSYFFVLSVLMMAFSSLLRQYRWVSFVMAAGAGLVCLLLWLAETRPRLAEIAIGRLAETRTEARFRFWRSACILASFALVVGCLFVPRDYRGATLAASGLGVVGWLVLAVAGRRRR